MSKKVENDPQGVLIGERLRRRNFQLSMHPRQERIFTVTQKCVDQRSTESGLEVQTVVVVVVVVVVVIEEYRRIGRAIEAKCIEVRSQPQRV